MGSSMQLSTIRKVIAQNIVPCFMSIDSWLLFRATCFGILVYPADHPHAQPEKPLIATGRHKSPPSQKTTDSH